MEGEGAQGHGEKHEPHGPLKPLWCRLRISYVSVHQEPGRWGGPGPCSPGSPPLPGQASTLEGEVGSSEQGQQ